MQSSVGQGVLARHKECVHLEFEQGCSISDLCGEAAIVAKIPVLLEHVRRELAMIDQLCLPDHEHLARNQLSPLVV